MRMTWTLTGPEADRPPTDVVVEAPAGATLASLLPHLIAVVAPGAPSRSLAVSGVPVPGEALVGHPPLVEGVAVTLGSPMAPPLRDSAELCVAVVAGPDCGHRRPLGRGGVVIGRSGEADLGVEDPGLSRRHCRLDLSPAGPTITDLGSTNGTWLDGIRLGADPTPLTTGAVVLVGSTRLRLVPTAHRSAASVPRGNGTIAVNRSPREPLCLQDSQIRLPDPPVEPHRARVPWLAMLLPLPIAAVLAVMLGPHMLMFAVLTPVMMGGQAVSDRVGTRRRYAGELAAHAQSAAAVRADAAGLVRVEQVLRRRLHGDASATLHEVSALGARLWERRLGDEDAMSVRLGWGTASARVELVDADGSQRPTVADVPIAVSLDTVGVLGLCGPRAKTVGVARGLVGQAVTALPPGDLVVWVAQADQDDRSWDWVRRIPHAGNGTDPVTTVANLSARLDERSKQGTLNRGPSGRAGPTPAARHLLVVDGAEALRGLAGLAELLDRGPSTGLSVIALDGAREALPVECAVTVDLDDGVEGGQVIGSLAEDRPRDLVPDVVGAWWSERLSRRLAPLRDAAPTSSTAVPQSVRLLELHDDNALEVATLRDRWEARTAPEAILGAGTDGAFAIDLRRDGPHVLVGGTTGSGKSELLQTMIASLALTSSPHSLGFVLVDYKGGAAFGGCAGLPHTLGLVTDLDDHLAARALTSLQAELRRRERILRDAGVPDLAAHEKLAGSAPLGRLVIVIDEFRVLAEELPAFIDGVVRIAAVGRSLGVHLVLATQRPAGVITPDIRANVNLRIALRVRDRVDSEDVIEGPDAAAISESTPGRALARTGGPLHQFQTALVTAPPAAALTSCRAWPSTGPPPAAAPGDGPTDLDRIVTAVSLATEAMGQERPPSPWLPPLPDRVTGLPVARGIALGVVDLPSQQSQRTWAWDPSTDGHVLLAGGPGSGRTTAVRSVGWGLAAAYGPSEVHLYAVEGVPGSLTPLRGLAPLGTVVGRDDPSRLTRLLVRLRGEVAWRQRSLAAAGHSNLTAWTETDPLGAKAIPPIVLLVDDWDSLVSPESGGDHGETAEQLMGLARDGASAGLRLVVAGGRSLMLGRMSSLASHRLILRLADPADVALAGLPRASIPSHQPPGRAVRSQDGAEVQLVVRQRSAAQEPDHGSRRDDESPGPVRLKALPREVDGADLTDDGRLWLGVGGDDASPIAWDPPLDGPRLLVAGPGGSGRTTALASLAQRGSQAGLLVAWVSASGSACPKYAGVKGISDAQGFRDFADGPESGGPARLVLVDDVSRLAGSELEAALMAWQADLPPGDLLVCAGETRELLIAIRGLGVEVARHRTGLLLCPANPADGALLGVRAPRCDALPGRGVLVRRGECVELQTASARRSTAGLP